MSSDNSDHRLAMAEERARNAELGSQLSRYIVLLERERAFRRDARGRFRALAVDFDVIYPYLAPRKPEVGHVDLSGPLMATLAEKGRVRFTLLPGTVAEFVGFTLRMAESLGQAASLQRLFAEIEEKGFERSARLFDIQPELRQRLVAIYGALARSRHTADRARRILSSDSLVPLEQFGLSRISERVDENIVRELSAALAQLRRGRGANNEVDAFNGACLLAAFHQNISLSMVSNSRFVHSVMSAHRYTGQDRLNEPPHLIRTPEEALFSLALEAAPDRVIEDLEMGLVDTERQVGAAIVQTLSGRVNDLIRRHREQIDELIDTVTPVASLADQWWTPSDTELAPDINLNGFLSDTISRLRQIQDDLAQTVNSLGERFDTRSTVRMLSVEHPALGQLTGLLARLGCTAEAPTVFIQNLVTLEKGGSMNSYFVNQQGRNLTAIVDSFKVTAKDLGDERGRELEERLQAFVDAVQNSSLGEDQKRDVLDASENVMKDVKETGKLTGVARLLWAGVREGLSSVPSAVKAWEALAPLLPPTG